MVILRQSILMYNMEDNDKKARGFGSISGALSLKEQHLKLHKVLYKYYY